MKKLFLFLIIVCSTLCVNAAPPLRSIVPMTSGTNVIQLPTFDVQRSTFNVTHEDALCASQAVVSGGSYLQHIGTPRVLTILAAFQDVGFIVNEPVQAFDQYLNGDTQVDLGNMNKLNVASVRQYFETCSHRQFSPQFDVVGPVVLPKKMSYYGGSNSSGSDDKFSEFCKDAMNQAKELVPDWSQYDNDGDNRIELVCIIFAGYGQNQGGGDSTLWAKASVQNQKLDNKLSITRFNCSPELFTPIKGDNYDYSQFINGTGVFIHEFSHCMGLPDLYATNKSGYVNNQGMETYSIMDYGLYNYNGFAPCPYTAWEQEVMGWTEIEEIRPIANSQQQIADLLPLIEGGTAYKVVNADNDRDFIVMENVQQQGLNKRSDGHGLLVYHVDYPYTSVNMTDSPNNNPGHPSVAVVPSGGLIISSYLRGTNKQYTRTQWEESLQAVPFPGTKSVVSLTNQMQLPNYCFWSGKTAKTTGFMLSGITEDTESGTVTFTVAPEDPVGISLITSPTLKGEGSVYDLQGRKVMNPTSGLYIMNGRKVVIR